MYFVGVDPDTVRPAFCLMDQEGKVLWLWCPKIENKRNWDMIHESNMQVIPLVTCLENFRACVESQYVDHGSKASSTLYLARNAGACQMVVEALFQADQKLVPPVKWKGSIPKDVHQARVLSKLGWGYLKKGGKSPYAVPKNPPEQFEHLKAGEWKHLVDAIGMAEWARQTYLKEQRTGMTIWDDLK